MSNVNLGTSVKSLYLGQKIAAYTGVIIHTGLSANGKEINYSAGNSSGYVLELDNPFGTQQMAYAILASLKLRSVNYQPFEADKALSDPAAEIGDGVTANGKSGIIMSIETDLTPLMASDLSAPLDEELGHEFQYEPKSTREFKRESAYTRARLSITQDEIRAEVARATSAEGTLSASISIQADRITSEVVRATGVETEMSSRITQTSDAITAEVTRATAAEGNLSTRITQNADSITAEVTRATGAEGTLSTRIDQRLDSITLSVSSSAGSSTFTIKDGSTTLDTKTLDLSVKAVNISGKLTVGQLADGSVVTSSQTETEYYLSTSSSTATGGSWSTTVPTWASGKYIWTRSKTTDTRNDNTTSVTYKPSQNGAYDKNLTTALSTASSAQTSANSAITRERTIYYSIAAGDPIPSAPTEWVSDITGDQNKWTCKRPEYSQSYPVLYTASERISVGGVFSCSAVTRDLTTTVIDGGNIITGSITANKISVSDLQALNATVGGWAIGTATLRKTTDTADVYLQSVTNAENTYNAICVRTRPNSSGSWTNQFYVRYNGYLYAKNANIEGTVTATSGTIGGVTISNGILTGIKDINIQQGGISGGSSGSIGSGTITTDNTNYGINSGVNGGWNFNDATASSDPASYPSYFKAGYLRAVSTFVFAGRAAKWQQLTIGSSTYRFLIAET